MAAATPSLSWEPSRTRAFVVSVTGLCKAPSPCADEFVKVLQARGVSQVRCLKDSAATRSAVEASFKSFVSACQDPDETLKRNTLDLLFTMTNPKNIHVVAAKMLDALRNTLDE